MSNRARLSTKSKQVGIVRAIKQHPILSYCLSVLLWSFGWWSLILTVVPLGHLFDLPLNPMALAYMMAGLVVPSLAGLALTRVVDGRGSVRRLLARLGHWRVGWWWLVALIPCTLNAGFAGLYVLFGGQVSAAELGQRIGPAIGIGLTACLFEEFGWRGYLQAQLQRRYSPLVSALLVGLVWGGLWHFGADFLALGNLGWRALPLIVLLAPCLLTAHAVLLGWLYNNTRGSMLLCVVYHFSISSSGFVFSLNYPSYETNLLWTALTVAAYWAVAGVVILAYGRGLVRQGPGALPSRAGSALTR